MDDNKVFLKERVRQLDQIQKCNHNFELPNKIESGPEKQNSQRKKLVKLNRLKYLFNLENKVGERGVQLSVGQRQRIGIARA